MAYQALYRKWRPVVFDDVIGQSHITETIRNELLTDKLAHAYLFTGTRGTGKTTTAKIFSRAVNCLNPQNGNPCNECENCKAILNDVSLDVQEIDAASHTGVDSIRDIIDQLQYSPNTGKYKVYIIDEVHSLSGGAFNALLKTLEEPPSHVKFILATTEVHKIPATILSRCQRFDFKTISISDIVENIRKILKGENIFADDDALEYVAYLGDGSMRDSLSILDQCLAFKDNNLTLADVTDVVGAVDDAMLYEFASDVARKDISSVLSRFNECVNSGKNVDNIVKGLLSTFREIIMYKVNSDGFSVSKFKRSKLKECADNFDVASLVNYINILTDCIGSLSTFSSQRAVCECALIRLARPEMNMDVSSLCARIEALENKIALIEKNGVTVSVNQTAPVQGVADMPVHNIPDDIPIPEPPPEYQQYDVLPQTPQADNRVMQSSAGAPSGSDVERIIANWNDVKQKLALMCKLSIYSALTGVGLSAEGTNLLLTTDDQDKKMFLSNKENKQFIKDAIMGALGISVDIVVEMGSVAQPVEVNDVFANLSDVEKQFPVNFKLD